MTRHRAGVLAVRAVNQYRRRDVLTYLGLRYYLESLAARTDTWARDVAVDISLRATSPTYLSSLHFKDVDDRGAVSHRQMSLPGANEALAEAALIDECARVGGQFAVSPHVFSYLPATDFDRSGIFQPYMRGLRARHEAIAAACTRDPQVEVLFIDIKSFYQSIKIDTALPVWVQAATQSGLHARYTLLGERLLNNYANHSAKDGKHLLTGPMFSHLIGNLILRDLDTEISHAAARYFRYVDDITLIGTRSQISASLDRVRAHLERLGLELHDERSPKTLRISAKEWLQGEDDYAETRHNLSWPAFIGDLRKLLLWYPTTSTELSRALIDEGFRLPVPDYSNAIREKGHIDRMRSLVQKHWYQARVRKISVGTVLKEARQLRDRYETDMKELLDQLHLASGYARKRLLPKARYTLGRLTYLTEPTRLQELSDAASNVSGLFFQAEVARAVATGNVDRLITLGTNAAQAAAQPGRMLSGGFVLTRAPSAPADLPSLATIALNGVRVETRTTQREGWNEQALYRFAVSGSSRELMKTTDGPLRELACLHGVGPPKHAAVLDAPMDEAEPIALDAIEQARASLSF